MHKDPAAIHAVLPKACININFGINIRCVFCVELICNLFYARFKAKRLLRRSALRFSVFVVILLIAHLYTIILPLRWNFGADPSGQ